MLQMYFVLFLLNMGYLYLNTFDDNVISPFFLFFFKSDILLSLGGLSLI